MESSPQGRCGEIGEDMAIILITAAQLIFFTYFYQYIAWPTKGPDGSLTWLSLLTADYFRWLPFVTAASIIVIAASVVMIVYDRAWLRQSAWILFSILGITVVVSLLLIFPFDFSVIPNAAVADIMPTVVTVVLVLMAVFYGVTALVMTVRLRRHTVVKNTEHD